MKRFYTEIETFDDGQTFYKTFCFETKRRIWALFRIKMK